MARTHIRLRVMVIPTVLMGLAACLVSNLQEAPVLVEFHRSGGIAGVDEHLVVRSDGTAQLTRDRRAAAPVQVATDAMVRLRATLADIDFGRFDKEYLSQRGADLFQYEVVYQGRSVRTDDMAMPPSLVPLIDQLAAIVGAN